MKETTIEPYLPMLERFEEFFREELASRLSVESVDSVMEAAVENFHRILRNHSGCPADITMGEKHYRYSL